MQASCAGGKKRLRPPSISQEIKNIQLIEQLPYIANSWDIPGTPVQGNNLPNIDGAKLTIPFSISLSLNTNHNNIDKEIKNQHKIFFVWGGGGGEDPTNQNATPDPPQNK